MKKNITKIATFLFLLISLIGIAQGPPPPEPPPPVGLPIDNGLIILFSIGLLYGVYVILISKSREQ